MAIVENVVNILTSSLGIHTLNHKNPVEKRSMERHSLEKIIAFEENELFLEKESRVTQRGTISLKVRSSP